jgi:hypothetical protein
VESGLSPTSENIYDEETAWPATTNTKLDIKSKQMFQNERETIIDFI